MKTKKAKTASKFTNRVRFNWGYHDAANTFKIGNATPEKNFGFGRGGALDGLTSVADLLARHFDREYAQGWQQGFFDAQDGTYEGNSDKAWQTCLVAGTVTE